MTDPVDPGDYWRRRFHYERRSWAAINGRHLPTLKELVRGCGFMGCDVQADAQAFAERVIPRVNRKSAAGRKLVAALKRMTVDADKQEFLDAGAAFRDVGRYEPVDAVRGLSPWKCAVRCDLYAAYRGDRVSAWRVAAEAISWAYNENTPYDEGFEFAIQALGWLLFAAHDVPTAAERIGVPEFWLDTRDAIRVIGQRMVSRIVDCIKPPNPDEDPRVLARNERKARRQEAEKETGPEENDEGGSGKVVVVTEIGNADTSDGKRAVNEFKKIAKKPLPLLAVPDLADVRAKLLDEFPYAPGIVSSFVDALATRTHVELRPTILVGTPGCGKTKFASQLLEHLNVPHEIYSCGGVSDSSLAGTARRWTSGEPSLPLSLVKRHLLASPGIILDEIEKTGTSRHNGNLLDSLLGLLEPSSAKRWHDVYVEASVDLSHVVWIGTANTIDGVPGPLRDRCRVLKFPEPGAEHLETLARRLLVDAYASRGLGAVWATPLDGEELDALRGFWHGGSIRRLGQLVEAIVAARERDCVRN